MKSRYLRECLLHLGRAENVPFEEPDPQLVADLTMPVDGGPDRVFVRLDLGRDDPALAGLSLTASSWGRCLGIMIERGQGQPFASIGVGNHPRCGARLWDMMCAQRAGLAGLNGGNPQAPWMAIRLDMEATDAQLAGLRLYARRLAFAFCARRGNGGTG